MRSRDGIFFICLIASFIAGHITATHQAHAVTAPRAVMVSDEKSGALRFMIDGKEVARMTAGGLAVRDSIEFGGVFADVGPEGFDKSRKEP